MRTFVDDQSLVDGLQQQGCEVVERSDIGRTAEAGGPGISVTQRHEAAIMTIAEDAGSIFRQWHMTSSRTLQHTAVQLLVLCQASALHAGQKLLVARDCSLHE